MITARAAFALLAALAAAAPAAGTPGRADSVPPQFRGRWVETMRACRGADPDHAVLTIDRTGYSAPMELEGRVLNAGPVRSGTHTFSVEAAVGPQAIDGVLRLRRAGSRLVFDLAVVDQPRVHRNLVRCR